MRVAAARPWRATRRRSTRRADGSASLSSVAVIRVSQRQTPSPPRMLKRSLSDAFRRGAVGDCWEALSPRSVGTVSVDEPPPELVTFPTGTRSRVGNSSDRVWGDFGDPYHCRRRASTGSLPTPRTPCSRRTRRSCPVQPSGPRRRQLNPDQDIHRPMTSTFEPRVVVGGPQTDAGTHPARLFRAEDQPIPSEPPRYDPTATPTRSSITKNCAPVQEVASSSSTTQPGDSRGGLLTPRIGVTGHSNTLLAW